MPLQNSGYFIKVSVIHHVVKAEQISKEKILFQLMEVGQFGAPGLPVVPIVPIRGGAPAVNQCQQMVVTSAEAEIC